MTAKQSYLEEQIKKSFKSYTLEGLQSLVTELENQNDIDLQVKKDVYNIFFKKCAAKLRKTNCVEFKFGGCITDIFDGSEGGWYMTTYSEDAKKDEDGNFNEDDELDGGLCTGSAFNAVTFFINLDNYWDSSTIGRINKYYIKSLLLIRANP